MTVTLGVDPHKASHTVVATWPPPARSAGFRASRIRSTRWRWPGRRCRNRSCPRPTALTAAKFLAEVAGVGRFRSEAALATHAGAAPLECSSGPGSATAYPGWATAS
jgi:hypothetical protein